MELKLLEEFEDGTAAFRFEMTAQEVESMVLFGIRRALEEAAKQALEWKYDDNSKTDNSNE